MSGIVLLVPIVLPLAAGLAMFGIKKLEERRLRDRYVTAVLLVCAAAAAYIVLGPQELELHWQMSEDFLFCLKADGLAKIFLALVSLAWMCNGFFAFEYMSRRNARRSFSAFTWCATGLCAAWRCPAASPRCRSSILSPPSPACRC